MILSINGVIQAIKTPTSTNVTADGVFDAVAWDGIGV